jgi:hypothetical protein
MAKELPYFKFEPQAWDTGNIQMCGPESKGIFIDLCSLYWSRLGELPYALALQKLCSGKKDALQELMNHQIISVVDDQIVIEFLDEQLQEFGKISDERRKSAQKRWSNANALQKQSKSNAIREEKKREDKIRREKKRESTADAVAAVPATLDERALIFRDKVAEFLPEYSKEMLREFYNYWTEKNEGGRRMRFEMEKVFDIRRRLVTWHKNEKKRNGTSKNDRTEFNHNELHIIANHAGRP